MQAESNVHLSADGTMGALSGDTVYVFDASTGNALLEHEEFVPAEDGVCFGTEYKFSPDGRYAASKKYDTAIHVYETGTFQEIALIETKTCSQGLAFTSDGKELVVTDAMSIDLQDFSTASRDEVAAVLPEPPLPLVKSVLNTNRFVAVSPTGEWLLTHCNEVRCDSYLVPPLNAAGQESGPTVVLPTLGSTNERQRHPSFSKEGQWIVAGGTLLHLPTGEARELNPDGSEASFTPNGDIILSERDGTLIRYCLDQ